MARSLCSIALLIAAASCGVADKEERAKPRQPDGASTVIMPTRQHAIVLTMQQKALRASMEAALAPISGRRGASVRILGTRTRVDAGYDGLMPQQSVSKLWVAMTLAEQVSAGRRRYDDVVTVNSADRALFHQPLARLTSRGPVTLTVGDLLVRSLTQSDNMANDILLRIVGGPESVRDWLTRNAPEIRFGPGDRAMQSAVSGLAWDPRFADRQEFERARRAVPGDVRGRLYAAYAADPVDGASARSIAIVLSKIADGSVPGSTDILTVMERSRTGHARLRSGLPSGWRLFHKTGTGQTWNGRTAGFNDVGVMVSPTGRGYAVAVMIGDSSSDTASMQKSISSVARAVVAYDAATISQPL